MSRTVTVMAITGLLALGATSGTADTAVVAAWVSPTVEAQMTSSGSSTYWVVLRERADLSAAHRMDWRRRGGFVVAQLKSTAERTQAGLRSLLAQHEARFTSYWAANVIEVNSDQATLLAVARRPEVLRIEPDVSFSLPDVTASPVEPSINGVEWNLANIRADRVWSDFQDRGEGIVVATIDTGAQFNHPALVQHYRGSLGNGAFDHNYNWFDPSSVCGSPSLVPCDNTGHGTHTTGTIVGDDGAGNQVGVAPGARWITAKGCETNFCSGSALLAAGQWVLAPTNLSGANPRPELRPDIVSNSWSGGAGSTWFQQVVRDWVASGIFPVFANGNAGPGCGSAHSPGDYPESYAVGAYGSSNTIASFSSRGPSVLGGVKPDISAPGVSVRSSVPGGSYSSWSGTSMATPHVAGTVALIWSIAPEMIGDINATRTVLDVSAIDTSDTSCGGTAADNDVYGDGRLDAFEAVTEAVKDDGCTVKGTSAVDVLGGTSGDDVICGYGGNDKIYASAGNDTIIGGDGVDILTYINSPNPVNVDLYLGTGNGWGSDSISQIENVTGSPYADDLGGDAGNNILGGWQGNDKLAGKEGADTENGGPGGDTLFVKIGNDVLDGGTGTDTISFVGSAVGVYVNLGAGTASGPGSVSLVNIERVAGSKYKDTIYGSGLANVLSGAGADDTINAIDGLRGNDKVDGGVGTDSCSADPGDTKVNCP
jgi:subtilisin family serine protease